MLKSKHQHERGHFGGHGPALGPLVSAEPVSYVALVDGGSDLVEQDRTACEPTDEDEVVADDNCADVEVSDRTRTATNRKARVDARRGKRSFTSATAASPVMSFASTLATQSPALLSTPAQSRKTLKCEYSAFIRIQ